MRRASFAAGAIASATIALGACQTVGPTQVGTGAPATTTSAPSSDLGQQVAAFMASANRSFQPTPSGSPRMNADQAIAEAKAHWGSAESVPTEAVFGQYSRAKVAAGVPPEIDPGPAVKAPISAWVVPVPNVYLPASGPAIPNPPPPKPVTLYVVVDDQTGSIVESIS